MQEAAACGTDARTSGEPPTARRSLAASRGAQPSDSAAAYNAGTSHADCAQRRWRLALVDEWHRQEADVIVNRRRAWASDTVESSELRKCASHFPASRA